MKVINYLAVLLFQGALAAPANPSDDKKACCPQGTPICPDQPDCDCPVSIALSPLSLNLWFLHLGFLCTSN